MRKVFLLKLSILLLVSVFFASGCSTISGRTAGQTVDDSAITAKINAKIVQDPALQYLKIDVDTFQGNVALSGTVPSREAQDRLVGLARTTEGVKSVQTNLVVQP